MQRTLLNSKIHRATVTHADLNYVGSISIDKDLMDAAGLLVNEQVHVLDINNGNRLTTYVIEAPRSSGIIAINGAAARLVNVGDLVIICAYAVLNENEIKSHSPKIVLVDQMNCIKQLAVSEEALKLAY